MARARPVIKERKSLYEHDFYLRAIESKLVVLLTHLLKYRLQPDQIEYLARLHCRASPSTA